MTVCNHAFSTPLWMQRLGRLRICFKCTMDAVLSLVCLLIPEQSSSSASDKL